MYINVSAQCIARLDAMVKDVPMGTKASRASMASAILEQCLMQNNINVVDSVAAYTRAGNDLPPVLETPSERLRRVREASGLSQGALASHLGYAHKSSVGNVELGRAPLEGALLAWVKEHDEAGAK